MLFYLLLMPVAIANLELDERQIARLLGGAMALAIVKAILGLVEMSEHLGKQIEGSSTLTYYEPTANWLMMIALLDDPRGAGREGQSGRSGCCSAARC